MMKNNYSILLLILAAIISNFNTYGQLNTGDIAFTAFNTDGDKDFAFVALVDIPINSTIYITDSELDGTGSFVSGEGILQWETGTSIINKGSIIVFTDVNSATLTVSIGSVTEPDAGFNPGATGDALFAYLGTDFNTPTTILAGLQIGNNSSSSGDLTNSGLTIGTTHIIIDNTASPDGGYYSGSRVSESSFYDYLPLLGAVSNWTTNTADGEATLPISTIAFSITGSALANKMFNMNNVNIYKSSNTNLRITGLENNNYNVYLYSLLGKEILSSDYMADAIKNIELPKVTTGIYIVKLTTDVGSLNKKIVIE